MDFIMQKPASLRGYALHRIAAGLARSEKVLFADCGDHLLLRTDKQLDVEQRPLRTLASGDIIGFELRACVGKKIKGKHIYFRTTDWRSRHEWLGRLQDRLNSRWNVWAEGCNLNRDTETNVRLAGFELQAVRVNYLGLVKTMIAYKPII